MRHSVKSVVCVARDTGFVCLPLPSCLACGLVSVTHFLPEASPTHSCLPRAGQVDAPEQGGHHRQERVRQGGGAVGGRRQARQEVRGAHGGHQGRQRLFAPSRQAEKVRAAHRRTTRALVNARCTLHAVRRVSFILAAYSAKAPSLCAWSSAFSPPRALVAADGSPCTDGRWWRASCSCCRWPRHC